MVDSITSFLQTLLVVAVTLVSAVSPCTEPSDAALQQQWSGHVGGQCADVIHGLHHVHPFRQVYTNKGMVSEETTCPSTSSCEGGICCYPWEHDDQAMCTTDVTSDDVKRRSLCPYTYREVHLDDVYPRTLTEAECTCTSCQVTPSIDGAACEPVHYHIPVLKRTGNALPDGTCEYTKVFHPLAVGCACAVAKTSS